MSSIVKQLEITIDSKILIVAPHQDDETLGCGGLIAKYPQNIEVLCLSDGAKCFETEDLEELRRQRSRELKQALSVAGVMTVYELFLPDGNLINCYNQIENFEFQRYNYIFVPNRFDAHNDHFATYTHVKHALKIQKAKARLFQYEVWTPLQNPNWCLDISDVIGIKKDMIMKYQSQLSYLDYTGMAEGLSLYRGASLHRKYAEVFYEESSEGDNNSSGKTSIAGSINQLLHKFEKRISDR